MKKPFLFSSLAYRTLQTSEGLEQLDHAFLEYLQIQDKVFYDHLHTVRLLEKKPKKEFEQTASDFFIELAQYVESFLFLFFELRSEKSSSLEEKSAIARCRQIFIQKRVANRYTEKECQAFDQEALRSFFTGFSSEQDFAKQILKWLQEEASFLPQLTKATHY